MLAVRGTSYGGPEVLTVEELPDPSPGAGEVLIRTEAVGVNYIDTYHRSGLYPVPVPIALGVEGAGIVVETGPDVDTVAAGDRVAWARVNGSYATHVVAPADRLVPLPAGIPPQAAAATMLQGMTAHYLSHCSYPLREDDTCLVHAAAGGVGLLLCQMAKLRGARVLATVSTAEKAELARGAGADEVILYTEQDFVPEVGRLTGGRGVDVVYDGVGRDTFVRGLDCLARRGSMILFGQASGPVEPLDPLTLMSKGSLYLQRPLLADYTWTRDELLSRAGQVLEWIGSGSLALRIGASFPLAEAADAHRALEGRLTAGKVLLIP